MNGSAIVTTTSAPTGTTVQSFCSSSNSMVSDLIITGSDIKWYDAATAGNLIPTSTILASGTYYASQTLSGCESNDRFAVTVTVIASPGAPTGSSAQTFNFVAHISDLVATGISIQWHDAPVGGNLYLSTALLVDGQTYYASQNDGCESTSRLAVTVSIALYKTVNLHLFLEGLYDYSTNTMVEAIDGNTGLPNYGYGISDKVNIDIFDASNSLITPIISLSGVDLLVNGLATFQVSASNNSNYYIRVLSRNHIETWSAIEVPFSTDPVEYDFTSSVDNAYGYEAQTLVSASPVKYAFYLGDLDQSGYVDSDDYNIFEYDAILGVVGFYPSDFNGSGYVDSEDYNVFEFRLIQGIVVQRP